MMPSAPAPSPDDAFALVGAAAKLLYANGQTTERTVQNAERFARALGISVTVFPTWGELVIRREATSASGLSRVEAIAAAPAGVDMNKVTLTLGVIDQVCDARLDAARARDALEAIAGLPPASTLRFVVLAAAGAAALSVIFGAADLTTLALIALSAGAGAALRRALAHVAKNFLAQPLCAALLAGVIAAAASHLLPGANLYLVALCPCMVLVPGPHLLNGALDLAHMRIGLGGARFGFAGLIILLISVGLIAGLALGVAGLPMAGPSAPVPLAYDVIAAGIAVSAFGTFFSMPWRTLPIPVAIGMIAHASRWLAIADGASLAGGALVACLIAATLVTPIANRLHLPFAAFAFASVVSLIPGVFLFRMAAGMVTLLEAGPAAAPALLLPPIQDGTTAAAILLAMAFGLILPKMLLERLFPKWSGLPAAPH
ncbi:threonine/serine exporter family protein [Roseixanthobacter glucoisosaccharinicivorans]|uniref:threonine/serine exporter family protein n=1 Tax=Roseixanthobacter glucoisosaccharinicivorans TaxID=3119923 RepID=UPI00372C60CE